MAPAPPVQREAVRAVIAILAIGTVLSLRAVRTLAVLLWLTAGDE
jgi:hypothetical protein